MRERGKRNGEEQWEEEEEKREGKREGERKEQGDIEKQEKGTGKGGDASYICFSSLASPSPQQATQHN